MINLDEYLLNGGKLSSLEKEFDDDDLVSIKFNDEWINTNDIRISLKTLLSLSSNSEKDYKLKNSSSRWQGLLGELNIDYADDNTKIYEKWVISWICTDTKVGLRAFYMEDELVCIAMQVARKERGFFTWVSKEAKQKVITYLLSLNTDSNPRINEIKTQIRLLQDELLSLEYNIEEEYIDFDSNYYTCYLWNDYNKTFSPIH